MLYRIFQTLIQSLALMACAAFYAGVAMASTDLVRIANAGEPQTLDPQRYNLRLEETLLNDLFMGLTTFGPKGDIVPGAAERWTVSEDGLTWTFHLRPGLRWSDGQPLTAADFVYSFRRLQDPDTAASLAYFMHMLKNAEAINAGELPVEALGVEALDERTLRLSLGRPYPYLLERLLYPTGFPVPRHTIERHGDDWVRPEHWVSNGAFVLREWVPQSHIELAANSTFHDAPGIERVRYVPVSNEQTAFNRYRAGELDVIGGFPIGELERLKRTDPEVLRVSELLSMFYLVFNTSRAPFDDVRVRQALSLAVDQTIITDRILKSGARPQTTFTPALIAAYDGVALPHASDTLANRQAAARALLEDAGFTARNPLRLELRHVAGIDNKKVNLAISGMWKAIGVQARLRQSDVRTHFADLRQADFEVAWAGWVGENNAEHYVSLLKSDIGAVNYGRFSNNTFDLVMARAEQTADRTARDALLRSAEEIAVHFYPVVPLYSNAIRRLVNPRLGGWYENPRDMHQSRYLYWSDEE